MMQENDSSIRKSSENKIYEIKHKIEDIKMKIEQGDASQELKDKLAELEKDLRVANELAYGRD